MKKRLRVTPLGGCGEIGMNMTVLQVDDATYLIDSGALFPDAGMPGVDLVIPEITMLHKSRCKPEAWLITHGHEDHIGALSFMYRHFPAPIYASDFTIELIKGKFEDAGIRNATIIPWVPGVPVSFRNIRLTPFIVNHSIAHALGFFIETKHGNILHTGDFRIDYHPPEKSTTHENIAKVLGKKDVKLMLSDSTNSFVKGTDLSENDLVDSFEKIIDEKTNGALVVATFASNIWRFDSIAKAAQERGKKVFLFGRSLHRNFEISNKLGLLGFPKSLLLEEDELKGFPKNRLVVVCTGSQGEPFSGASRLAYGTFDKLRLDANDSVVFSARAIPGNEKSIGALINQFSRLGCEIITAKEIDCHVSGHGFQEDLKKVLSVAKPKFFMPVHGEYRHLKKHISLAVETGVPFENCFLVENGNTLEIGVEPYGIVEEVDSGRDYVCQGGVFNSMSDTYRTRLGVAKNGLIVVSYVVHRNLKELICNPEFTIKGVALEEEALGRICENAFKNVVQKAAESQESTGGKNPKSKTKGKAAVGRKESTSGGMRQTQPGAKNHEEVNAFEEALRLQLRRLIEQKINYKCIITVLLSVASPK